MHLHENKEAAQTNSDHLHGEISTYACLVGNRDGELFKIIVY